MKGEEFVKKKSKAEVFADSDTFIKRGPGISPCMYKRWGLYRSITSFSNEKVPFFFVYGFERFVNQVTDVYKAMH